MAKNSEITDRQVHLDEHGHEVPNPDPIAIPAGFKRPPTLQEQVQRLVRGSLSDWAAAQGGETFEEADDYEIGDDDDPTSQYETFFDPVLGRDLSVSEFRQRELEIRDKYLKAQNEYFSFQDHTEILRRGAGGGQPPASTTAPPEKPGDPPAPPPKAPT